MHPSLLLLIRYFGFGVFSIGFFRYLHMGEVLLGATHLMLHVYVGGVLQLCLENKAEEGLFTPLSLFISKLLVDPRRHNNLLRQPGCLRWAFFLVCNNLPVNGIPPSCNSGNCFFAGLVLGGGSSQCSLTVSASRLLWRLGRRC